jgi:F-type H+-transporting ATPase subunit gamma
MPGSRDIKRRIKSISSTKKITRAMQMVSAVKMRRAQTAVAGSRPYADLARELASNLAKSLKGELGEITGRVANLEKSLPAAKKRIVMVVISSNRGQVGALNSNLISAVRRFILEKKEQGFEVVPITMGKKGKEALLHLGYKVEAEFEKGDKGQQTEDILPISTMMIDGYINADYAGAVIAYTKFVSTLVQKPMIDNILPFRSIIEDNTNDPGEKRNVEADTTSYLFEPNAKAVLENLIPRIVEAQLYRALLESGASEHSARMVMMKSATDAASELVDDLTLEYNQLRQASITTELAEITAGRIAME